MIELPIHIQIANDIKQQIELGIYTKHFPLPSENSLATQYHVSRVTVQKALRTLNNEDYIYSIPGKGSFAKDAPTNKYILKFNELNLFNKEQKQKLIGVEIVSPTPELIYVLHVHPQKKVIHIKRLITVDDNPVAYDSKYVPYNSGIPIVEVEINYSVLPNLLSNIASPYEIKRELNIYGSTAEGDIHEKLALEKGAPCVVVEQTVFDKENTPIGWGRIYLNTQYFKIRSLRE